MLTAAVPAALREALAEEAGGDRDASRAAAGLSRRYRERDSSPGPVARTRADVAAYAVARLPATYAATRVALGEVAARAPWLAPESHLDLGAGPGTALWAAADTWPTLRRATAVEAADEMARLGRRLAARSPSGVVAGARWLRGSLPDAVPAGPVDLVTLAYVLAELDEPALAETVDRAWAGAQALVIVEPGTSAGYERVLAARDRLVAAGATIAAPCPHERACPLAGTADWCHFAVRLPRGPEHRRAKAADLGHEDEKLSYVAAVRGPAAHAAERVLRHPQTRPGHVLLELCTSGGLRRETVSRRHGDRFRRARKVPWGGDLAEGAPVDGAPSTERR